mgnify:CR=1 FL=1
MASDLTVAVLTGGAVFHIHGFDDGVAAEFTFHIQQRTLDIMLSIFFAGGIGSIRLGTSAIEKAQEKIEANNFGIRKKSSRV